MFTRALRMQLAPIYPLIPLYFHANVRPGIKFPGRAARRQEESHIDSDVAIVSVFLESQTCLAPCLYLFSAQHSHLFDQGAEPKNRSRANDFLSKLNCKPTSTSPPPSRIRNADRRRSEECWMDNGAGGYLRVIWMRVCETRWMT